MKFCEVKLGCLSKRGRMLFCWSLKVCCGFHVKWSLKEWFNWKWSVDLYEINGLFLFEKEFLWKLLIVRNLKNWNYVLNNWIFCKNLESLAIDLEKLNNDNRLIVWSFVFVNSYCSNSLKVRKSIQNVSLHTKTFYVFAKKKW